MTVASGATVYLVGAGPGDPGLLTLRAAELLERADAVLYDALVNPQILERCSPEAELRFVGKRGKHPSLSQVEITELLIRLAGRHRSVVRLKGGDPFVFGRGGEEAEALRAAGIRFEVVPGISAGIAAPAYAGIPVTHRGLASSVAFLTGHEDPTKEESTIDWDYLAHGVGTLVLFMGVTRMRETFQRLIEAGRPADTPAAVVEWATYARQRTVTGDLNTLPERAADAGIHPPAVVIVGEVVGLREQLAWFETRPLFGKRVVVTRSRAQASSLSTVLESLGAEVVAFPTIRIAPPADEDPLLRAAVEADRYDWIVFTSVNGVARFWNALRAAGRDTRSLAGVSICAVGSATAAAVEVEGARADLVPERFVAEGVIAALQDEVDLAGSRVLLPRGELARSILPEALREAGAEVTDLVAYRTLPDSGRVSELRERLDSGTIDMITFTSSSTVQNFVDLMGTSIGVAAVASIGPITSASARALGLPVQVEAEESTIQGLVAAILEYWEA